MIPNTVPSLWTLITVLSALACAAPVSIARAGDGQIPFVGLDDDGNPVEFTIGGKDYTGRLSASMSAVQDSALPALERRASSRKSWMLRTVVIGVGVGLEAGLGPIIKIKAVPRFRVAFSNSTDPVMP